MSAPLANSGRGPRQQFELSIGCVPLRLEMSDAQLFGAASARYAAFTGAAAQPFTIALNEGAAPGGPGAGTLLSLPAKATSRYRHRYTLLNLIISS